MTSTPRTVAVLGPGGVGGLLGGLLARDGHRVICLAGDDTAAVLRRDGLRVESGRYGDFTVAVEARTRLGEPVDALFVTVKQTSLGAALERTPADILGDAVVVPLLNGVEHLAALRAHHPAGRVVAGTVRVETTRTAPGRIAHTSPFAALELASPPAGFTDLLERAGLAVTVRDDEEAMLWDKLAFLAPFALLTTRHRTDAATLRTERRAELTAVLDEVTAVARSAGAGVTTASVLAFLDGAPAGMRSSMQRDAEAGRPLELDAIGGAVLRAGAARGIATPATADLVERIAEAVRREG
ncbi:ketopantoate reductase family protein [Streptomyces sp. NPDC058417]|uniref:ketopantoate reductase family protein n=1 Tax=unclassified Streptomyces TaxID=2593676 RepID=UPI00366311A5